MKMDIFEIYKNVKCLLLKVNKLEKQVNILSGNTILSIDNLEANNEGEIELTYTNNSGSQNLMTTNLSKYLIKYNTIDYSTLNLIPNPSIYEYAYVRNDQGTPWLPGSLGGTYYPSGLYTFNGTEWVHDKDLIYEQLNTMLTTVNFYETTISNNILPTSFPLSSLQYLNIDIDNMTQDIDISSYNPLGLREGCEVRIRKIDNSNFKIIYNDNTNTYSYINTKGEFITLIKFDNNLKIN